MPGVKTARHGWMKGEPVNCLQNHHGCPKEGGCWEEGEGGAPLRGEGKGRWGEELQKGDQEGDNKWDVNK